MRSAGWLAVGCAWIGLMLCGCESKPRVWIYTSIYKEVIAEMKPLIARALPDLDVRWYQSGSENVAARINTELVAGRTQADLILTSDPFWYLELKKAGKLAAYDSPAAREVPAELRDPDHAFATVRVCMMVLAHNPDAVKAGPAAWADLARGEFNKKVSMGSPVESGTMFTATAMLARLFGWEWFGRLRAQELLAAGGNGSVITRMQTRERPVGIVLLENLLKARAKGSHVEIDYPSDGAIPIPSPIALTRDSRHPEAAKRVYDWFFSDEAQRAIVRGSMYSPIARMPAPAGAVAWDKLARQKWSPALVEQIYAERAEIKRRFTETVLR